MDALIRDVTLETVDTAIAVKTGIKPGEHFSIVVVDEAHPRPSFSEIAATMRATAVARGMTDEIFDSIMNDQE